MGKLICSYDVHSHQCDAVAEICAWLLLEHHSSTYSLISFHHKSTPRTVWPPFQSRPSPPTWMPRPRARHHSDLPPAFSSGLSSLSILPPHATSIQSRTVSLGSNPAPDIYNYVTRPVPGPQFFPLPHGTEYFIYS